MSSEKQLARKISIISTSVFAVFLVCLVVFTRYFLTYREQDILKNIDTSPIQGVEFGTGGLQGEGVIWLGDTGSVEHLPVINLTAGPELLPNIEISTGGLISIDGDVTAQGIAGSLTVSASDGLIFESLRDSIVIQDDGKIIKNGMFYFTDISIDDFRYRPEYFAQKLDKKIFLFRKVEDKDKTIFISRDITNIELLIKNLIKLSIVAIILFIILIYFLSRFLARLTLSPIHKNNILLKEFNHSLAHEIKTPLSVIRLNLERLESRVQSKLVSSSVEEVDTISSITDAMLFISEGTISRESETVRLHCYVQDFVERYYPGAIEVQGTSDIHVQIAPILLDRILTNLCENATKYGSGKPVIHVLEDGFMIENISKKTIDTHSLERLGTPFFQLDREDKNTGSGLGLSIVKRIIEMLGWNISFTYKNKIFGVHIITKID